jgi:hypothetical protein
VLDKGCLAARGYNICSHGGDISQVASDGGDVSLGCDTVVD